MKNRVKASPQFKMASITAPETFSAARGRRRVAAAGKRSNYHRQKNRGAGFAITTLCGASHWLTAAAHPRVAGYAINCRQWSEGDEN
ncbi:MAG: hypothetical protein V3R65_09255 [Acidiferrobacterales bacterium]